MWNKLLGIALALFVFAGLTTTAAADAPRPDGRTYAVLVGVADYPSSPLPRTDVDAQRIGQALQRHLPEDRLRMQLLLNAEATRANVTRALAEVAQQSTERDEVIFFFSGHGSTEPDETDGDEGDRLDETIELYDGSLRDDELARMLEDVKSRLAIVALDSCFSGGFLFDVANEPGRMAMFSSDEDLTSAVPSQEAGGWLSLYLAEALEGRADGAADGVAGQAQDGQLTALEIEMYVEDRFAAQQRISASDPGDRTVGYQRVDIKRTGVAPDSVFMNLGGPVVGGTERRVVFENRAITLPGTQDFGALPRVDLPLEAGHTYVVETFELAGSTDTVLELRRQQGAAPSERDPVLAQNDDAGDGLASAVRWTADAPGTYYAVVHPYAPETGGTFGLRLVQLVESSSVTTHRDVIAEQTNVQLPGTMDVSALPTLELDVEAGNTYVFETFDLAGSTDTVLELRRAQGAGPSASDPVVAQNDDAGGTLASRLQWTASDSGRYYVVVRPYHQSTGGSFSLRATEVRREHGARPPTAQPPTARPSTTTPGALLERPAVSLPMSEDFAAMPTFPVTFDAGRHYTIETYDLVGSTDTVLELRRMQGAAPSPSDPVVAQNDDAGMTLASRIDHTATDSGAYYVLVRPYMAETGGTFGLRVTAR